jgi:hypothetical protein
MEEYLTIENLLIIIIFFLFYISQIVGNILSKISEIREETAMFKRQYIPKDDQ